MADAQTKPSGDPPSAKYQEVEDTYRLGQLYRQIAQDPKHRKELLRIYKESTKLPVPELDLLEEAEAKVAQATDASKKDHEALQARVISLEQRLARKSFQEREELTDEEMKTLGTFAKEKGITNPDVALDYYRQSELGRPRSTGGGGGEALAEEAQKELYKIGPVNTRGLKEWAEREAAKVLGQMRRRRGA